MDLLLLKKAPETNGLFKNAHQRSIQLSISVNKSRAAWFWRPRYFRWGAISSLIASSIKFKILYWLIIGNKT